MAIGKSDKIGSWEWRKNCKMYLKKITNKRMRKLGKKMLGDAPIKNEYQGWST